MRSSWQVAVFAALLAGGVYASATRQPVDVKAGNEINILVQTPMQTLVRCYVVTPARTTVELIPSLPSDNRFELQQPNALTGCAVTVHNANRNDNGVWELHSESDEGEKWEQLFDVTVTGDEEDDTIWLTQIDYLARPEGEVSMTLNRLPYDEECFIRTPEGQTAKLGDNSLFGIKLHSRSDLVSCRITIGPMDENLLGTWSLCGKYVKDQIEHERCQSTNITWANNNANIAWDFITRAHVDQPVHFGKTMTPTVTSFGTTSTCHVITPNGEDIIVTPESEYAILKRVNANVPGACSIAIGPLNSSQIGDWVVYGLYSSSLRPQEVRMPMTFYLYDEDNPDNQAYNVTTLDPINRIINLASTIEIEVTGTGTTDHCFVKSPTGQIFDYRNTTNSEIVSFIEVDSRPACRVSVGPIAKEMLGRWQLTGKFSNNGQFNERVMPINIIQEDPENPIEDGIVRRILNETAQRLETAMGASHRIVLYLEQTFITTHESCHLQTPNGLQYIIMEGFNVPGVEVINEPTVACGVTINLESEDLIGEWTLFARQISYSQPTERRLPFTIYVEEFVNALPKEAIVANQNDLHIRLENPTNLAHTCALYGPGSGNVLTVYQTDQDSVDYCGYILHNVGFDDSGKWEITYGTKIIYRAVINVTVTARWQGEEKNLVWVKDRPVVEVIGPEDAVYCKIEDPNDFIVFEGFGKCNITLDRVTMEHTGVWKMAVGSPGRVVTDKHTFSVTVEEAEPKTLVTTGVSTDKPSIILSCSLPAGYEVNACKFRDPSGEVLIASHGVGEDRYIFHGTGVSVNTDVHSNNCGIRITNPATEDLGLWRCAMDTDGDTYYGFLTVLCPWAMMDPNVAESVVSEPILSAEKPSISSIEGDLVTMSCSVQSAIRYCYFRARNGTVFNVRPGSSDASSTEYVGAGLDAGECGIRFSTLAPTDTGAWSCHVGFPDEPLPEQRASFNVTIEAAMVVNQYVSANQLMVEGVVHSNRPLDYCRYVRIDGVGFTWRNLPSGYVASNSSYSIGRCSLQVNNPTILDHHPWTVIAKIRGQDAELAGYTAHTINIETTTTPQPETPPSVTTPPVVEVTTTTTTTMRPTPQPVYRDSSSFFIWMFFIMVLSVCLIGALAGPKRNRKWAYARATTVRTSFRNGFTKKPVPTVIVSEKNTSSFA